MNVLIVYAHPSKRSFTYKVFEEIKKGLQDFGHEIEVSDLYEMDFRPDMSEEEYNREGFAEFTLSIPEDIKREQEKIEKSSCIIFVYPVWWSDCPAKLKGWFDRVYTVGYAYGNDEMSQNERKMKTIEYGLVVCTAGHPNDFLVKIGISESMRNVMMDDRLGKRFNRKEMIILGGTLNIEEVREQHLKMAYDIGKEIKTRCLSK